MGDLLRDRIADDVAAAVTLALGNDAEGSPVYWQTTATVIDTYLQTSIFASTISEHKLNEAMSNAQLQSELPLAYARGKQRLAVPIYTGGDATQQYLASQILTGFTTFWKRRFLLDLGTLRRRCIVQLRNWSRMSDVFMIYTWKQGGCLMSLGVPAILDIRVTREILVADSYL